VDHQGIAHPEPRRADGERNDSVFRPNIQETAFDFGCATSCAAPGAAYDVRGDGKMKVFGSWGRLLRLGQVRLARGSFGGDIWNIYYRARHDGRVQPQPEQHAAAICGTHGPGRTVTAACRTSTRSIRTSADAQDATNVGFETQINPTTVFGATYVHNKLPRTIEDVGSLDHKATRSTSPPILVKASRRECPRRA
jgi:hypothetical protein